MVKYGLKSALYGRGLTRASKAPTAVEHSPIPTCNTTEQVSHARKP